MDPKGLPNIGATCYFNATLQALLSSPIFVNAVMTKEIVPGNYLHAALVKFINIYKESPAIISADAIKELFESLQKYIIEKHPADVSNHIQLGRSHDPLEMIQYIVEAINLEKLFNVGFKFKFKCVHCEQKNTISQLWGDLILNYQLNSSIPFAISIQRVHNETIRCKICEKANHSVIRHLTMVSDIIVMRYEISDEYIIPFDEMLAFSSNIPDHPDRCYKLVSKILYPPGHYFTIGRRNDKFVIMNDSSVSEPVELRQCPRIRGLIYELIKL